MLSLESQYYNMSIFSSIWEFLKRVWKALVDFFNPPKKPIVRITIMAILYSLFMLPVISQAQRIELQSVLLYLQQTNIENTQFWSIVWETDSVNVYKEDTLNVKMRNDQGVWVNYTESGRPENVLIRIHINKPYNYDVEYAFNIRSRNVLGNANSDFVYFTTYFMASDINKRSDSDTERGYVRGDQLVDGRDLAQLSREYGKYGVSNTVYEDITGDGNIDGLDLIQLSRDFGRTHQ